MRIAKKISIALLTVMVLVQAFQTISVRAEDIRKIMSAVTADDIIKVYVRGTPPSDEAEFQIADAAVKELKSYSVEEDDAPFRTLLMLDNSFSIPVASREKIKEAMKAIIGAHGNNEYFRIATYSQTIAYLSDDYSKDYTALQNIVDSIVYANQDTYLTEVLSSVIDDIEAKKFDGYTRIIIISDGVDQKPIGVTRDELNKKLEQSDYPVYTIGSKTGVNNAELENLFAISRTTGAEYGILEELSADQITEMAQSDHSLTVFQGIIPDKVKTGGRQNCKLTLDDGTALICSASVPFALQEEKMPEPIKRTVSVNFLDADGRRIADRYSEKIDEGTQYDLSGHTKPDIEGYVFDHIEGETAGTVGDEDVFVTVYYKANQADPGPEPTTPFPEEHTITVNYLNTEGSPIAESYVATVMEGDGYDLTEYEKIQLDGYAYHRTEGEIKGIVGDGDTVVNVFYDVMPEKEIPMPLILAAGAATAAVIACIVLGRMSKKKKEEEKRLARRDPIDHPLENTTPEQESKTLILDEAKKSSDTVMLTPGNVSGPKRYRVIFTDASDSSRSFRCELVNEITIGRKPDNNIVISDDTAVHGHQGSLSVKNGAFYITDLPTVQNHMLVNDNTLKPGLPQLIVSNARVRIGRYLYVVKITET